MRTPLTLSLVFGYLAVALAGSAEPGLLDPRYGDFTYQTNGASITITGYWNTNDWGTNYWCTNSVAVIPRTINNLPVTSIGDKTFFACEHDCFNMSSVTIPDSVTNIGYYAFAECRVLTNLTIPNGVVGIGYGAFDNCCRLPNLTIPDGVISIGDNAFDECNSLTHVTIPASVTNIGGAIFGHCRNLQSILVDATSKSFSSVGGVLFDKKQTELIQCPNSRKANHYKVPDGVVRIGRRAFYCCSLSKITLPSTVTKIDDAAFKGCTNLTSMTIPKDVIYLGKSAFADCDALANIYFKGNAPVVGDFVFQGSRKYLTAHYLSGTTGWSKIMANPWDDGGNWRIIKHWKQERNISNDADEPRESSGAWGYFRKVWQRLVF